MNTDDDKFPILVRRGDGAGLVRVFTKSTLPLLKRHKKA
jgi:hypothetical protein